MIDRCHLLLHIFSTFFASSRNPKPFTVKANHSGIMLTRIYIMSTHVRIISNIFQQSASHDIGKV